MRVEYLIPLAAYLSGSVPFGYILVRLTEGTDIRSVGSGNIGATNVYRKNPAAGILTLLLDAGKGYFAVLIAIWLGGDANWQAIAAVSAILGHMFTFFLGFKGGKGVAAGAGAYLAVSPKAVASTLLVFILVAALTRYISLASILAASSFPLWIYLYREPAQILIWALVGSALIVARHHENIRRLLSGRENKFAPGGRT